MTGSPIDGFWLPKQVRAHILPAVTEYDSASFASGQPARAGDKGAITVRWPRLDLGQWNVLFTILEENRRTMPAGQEYWRRLCAALDLIGKRFSNPSDPLRIQLLSSLPGYTGFSQPMVRAALDMLEMISLGDLPGSFSLDLKNHAAGKWQPMPNAAGKICFFPGSSLFQAGQHLPIFRNQPLFYATLVPDVIVGYGAGNVPGTALLIILLAQAATLFENTTPVIVVKNSRREPIFTPAILQALEEADPGLMANCAVLVWDYLDKVVQEYLLQRADLVLAAAGDSTIAELQTQIERTGPHQPGGPAARFHAHGHKTSFTAIGKEMLVQGTIDETTGQPVLDITALLAALDSVFWDQFGCLSSRIHFVELGGQDHHNPFDYAARLANQMRLLAQFLPRGAWPRRLLFDAFDFFKYLESTGQARVMSDYDDEFLVVVDNRTYSAEAFHSAINKCQSRIVIVRPVGSLEEIPNQYLKMIPPGNLQSLSVAVSRPDRAGGRFLDFAMECGKRGITAIRTVGRGAFPQTAYSWDGFVPLDLVQSRPSGRFTTIEYDDPYRQMIDTYRMFLQRGAVLEAPV